MGFEQVLTDIVKGLKPVAEAGANGAGNLLQPLAHAGQALGQVGQTIASPLAQAGGAGAGVEVPSFVSGGGAGADPNTGQPATAEIAPWRESMAQAGAQLMKQGQEQQKNQFAPAPPLPSMSPIMPQQAPQQQQFAPYQSARGASPYKRQF